MKNREVVSINYNTKKLRPRPASSIISKNNCSVNSNKMNSKDNYVDSLTDLKYSQF